MTGRTLLALLPAAAIIVSGCSAFRAQHSAEMYELAAAVPAPTGGFESHPDATFAAVQEKILTPSCAVSGCHVSPASEWDDDPPENLTLVAGASYDLLVGIRANQKPALRVAPGDPDGSYLMRKVTGQDIAWNQMPLQRPPLTDEQLELLRNWILAGAPR